MFFHLLQMFKIKQGTQKYHQDTIKVVIINTLQWVTKKKKTERIFQLCIHKKRKEMCTWVTTGRGLHKLASFETTLKSNTLVKTHSTTKDIQE